MIKCYYFIATSLLFICGIFIGLGIGYRLAENQTPHFVYLDREVIVKEPIEKVVAKTVVEKILVPVDRIVEKEVEKIVEKEVVKTVPASPIVSSCGCQSGTVQVISGQRRFLFKR